MEYPQKTKLRSNLYKFRISIYIILSSILFIRCGSITKVVVENDFDCNIVKDTNRCLINLQSYSHIQYMYDKLIENDSSVFQILFYDKILDFEGIQRSIYINQSSAIVECWDLQNNEIELVDSSIKIRLDSLVNCIEHGIYRQACFSPGSNGRQLVLIIKKRGDLLFIYESPQYSYEYLEDIDKQKIINSLHSARRA